MTVIAFDGKSIATDRLADDNGIKYECAKIVKLDTGEILAFTGFLWHKELLTEWYINGCKPSDWPDFQKGSDWSTIVLAKGGLVKCFDQGHLPSLVLNKFYAWGSGAKFAMGAMAMGASAKEAVEITNQVSTTCGMGVDVFDIMQTAKLEAV